jgi:hypothetical protein
MQRIMTGVAALVLGIAGCSSDSGGTTSGDTAQLSIVNALPAGNTAKLQLDASTVPLPASGTMSHLSVAAGAHRLQVQSSGGQVFASLSFAVGKDRSRTVVLSGGLDTATVAVANDTIATNPGGSYHSVVGSLLLVNSAPGAGPFDIYVSQANSDSIVHMSNFAFGSGTLPPPAPYGFYVPFLAGTYTIDITNPGDTTPLASTTLMLAVDDRWTVILTRSIEGGLVLQAVRQQ